MYKRKNLLWIEIILDCLLYKKEILHVITIQILHVKRSTVYTVMNRNWLNFSFINKRVQNIDNCTK
jgi:hypothetical protein